MINTNDLKIVDRLMKNARATWAELGGLIGLSGPAAAERVHKLEESNVIRGYSVLVDPEAVGFGLAAFIAVTLAVPANRSAFLSQLAEMPEVLECHHVAGDEDYLLKVRCRSTSHLETVISEKIKGIPGVMRTKTTIVLSTVKESIQLPVCLEK